MDAFSIRRRTFLEALGGGIAVGITTAQPSVPQQIGAWIHIAADSMVTVYCGKCEMGQNIRTSLAQAVAEELSVPVDSVRMVLGDTALTPYDAGTFSSRTTPFMAPVLRRAAAAARELLIRMAAEKLEFAPASLSAEDGFVRHATSGETISYGELARGKKLLETIPADVALRPASEWTVAGTSAPKAGGRDFVTGRHLFPSDRSRPGMVFGKILRPPAYGAALVSASAPDGVELVRDGEFAGVVAPGSHAAEKALASVNAEWKRTPQGSSREFLAGIKAHSAAGEPQYTAGSVEAGLAAAEVKLEAAYTLAFVAHAPLEPRAAVAEWSADRLTVWTGTTSPFGVRTELARLFGLPEDNVRVIVPDVGSGFCGKSRSEAAVEAARLAKAVRKPVKVVWTREEEFTWAWFRPAGLIEVRSGAVRDGALRAWEFHNYNSGVQAIRTPYQVPHQRIEFHPARSPLRQGSYRALAAVANFFARESHMDEMAAALGMDPLAFRLKNTTDARLRAVFEAAAGRFGWGRSGGAGLAGGFEKGAYVATCAEVEVHGPDIKVLRVVTAYDCGAVINPNHLKNQVEGGTMMAIGGALFESIEAEDGRILNPRFSQYRVPRFGDAPSIETVLVNRKDLPSFGVGETPICAVAPAIANAVFRSTGRRLRSLPLRLE